MLGDPVSSTDGRLYNHGMFHQIDPVAHSICGLTGELHNDYRADLAGIQPLGRGWRRIFLRLSDDCPKPAGAVRRPTISASVVAPELLENYGGYRVELWRRIERGESLADVTL